MRLFEYNISLEDIFNMPYLMYEKLINKQIKIRKKEIADFNKKNKIKNKKTIPFK